jgi:hypothetical protein
MLTVPSAPVPAWLTVAQVAPVYPAGQAQVKLLTPSVQVPPFWQGLDAQSSMLVAQVAPAYPAGQAQVKLLTPSVQAPPFRQGLGRH